MYFAESSVSIGGQPLPTSNPAASTIDTVIANPQTNASRSVDVVTMKGFFQEVEPRQDPTDNLLHQVQQERIGDTNNADPADDLLSLLTDSSPTASAFSGRSSTAAGIDSS